MFSLDSISKLAIDALTNDDEDLPPDQQIERLQQLLVERDVEVTSLREQLEQQQQQQQIERIAAVVEEEQRMEQDEPPPAVSQETSKVSCCIYFFVVPL